MYVTVASNDAIKQTQNSEYAAWYTNYLVLPGKYDLKVRKNHYYPHHIEYYANVKAVVTDDYYGSHFGGVAIGKYDTEKNKGRIDDRELVFTPMEVLTHKSITLNESDYDIVLVEALERLAFEIRIQHKCIQGQIENDNLSWISGHAKTLANVSVLYENIHAVKSRRDYRYPHDANLRNTTDIHVVRTIEFPKGVNNA